MVERQATAIWLNELDQSDRLSPALNRVLQILMTNPKLASYGEVARIAAVAGVNSSSVVRCAQALGFAGWPALQLEIRARYLASLTSEETFATHSNAVSGPGHSAIRQDIQNLKDALESVDPDVVTAVVNAIATARRTVVIGTGTFSAPGQIIAHLGSIIGFPISLETRGAVHLSSALADFDEDDVLVVVNVWRPIRDLLNAARVAKESGGQIVAITDTSRGPYRALADYSLVVPSEGVSFFQSVTAATSLAYGIVDGLAQRDSDRTKDRLAEARRRWEVLHTYEQDDGA